MEKDWYKSKTLWGGFVSSLCFILQLSGVARIAPDEQETLTQALVGLATMGANVAGIIMVIWGRMTAKGPIKGVTVTSGTNTQQ